jgi:hypothetical protein
MSIVLLDIMRVDRSDDIVPWPSSCSRSCSWDLRLDPAKRCRAEADVAAFGAVPMSAVSMLVFWRSPAV